MLVISGLHAIGGCGAGEAVASVDAQATHLARSQGVDTSPAERPCEAARSKLQRAYPHIELLGAGDDARVAPDVLNTVPPEDAPSDAPLPPPGVLIEATDEMLEAVVAGLAQATPDVLAAVRRIGVARWPAGTAEAKDYAAFTSGPDVVLNAAYFDGPLGATVSMPHVVVHELAHAYHDLLEAAARSSAQLARWTPEVQASARARVKARRLEAGVLRIWNRIHATGVSTGRAGAYRGEIAQAVKSVAEANESGFASPGGSLYAEEDLAEYVATVQLPTPALPGYCPVFSAATQLTPKTAIPYLKLTFLRDIGAIDAARYDACVGHVVPATPTGLTFEGGAAFVDATRAAAILRNDEIFFRIAGDDGAGATLALMLRRPGPSTPVLGLYQLDAVRLADLDGHAGSFAAISHPTDPSRARASAGGLVLVTEYSAEAARGVIFDLTLQDAAGVGSDAWSLGTFSIPLAAP